MRETTLTEAYLQFRGFHVIDEGALGGFGHLVQGVEAKGRHAEEVTLCGQTIFGDVLSSITSRRLCPECKKAIALIVANDYSARPSR